MSEAVIVERKGRVAILRLNRPQALNALNAAVLEEMLEKASALDAKREVGCLIVTGSEKAFAAGADIKEMADRDQMDMYYGDYFSGWDRFARLRTPKIAAVAGYALGGGCELAMMCDFIIAADNAKFGQPEIKLGVIPGMGGSQRMARYIGKAKTMDMVLTGRMMDAAEAERCGLVSRVVPAETLMDAAMEAAETIAGYSKPATMVAKEAVDRAFETSLAEGLHYERRVFFGLFAGHDQKEGMAAFTAKRKAEFKHE
ncbi:MAG: enoyl-CoA hydratase [Pikeienuella sp.]|uniref:enoyl-CoA hydratase n=1 Tax=Pikeienuella sp. TaxID=2831957 RepID=UPI003918DBCD